MRRGGVLQKAQTARARTAEFGMWNRMIGCAAVEPCDSGPSAYTAGLAGPVGQSCWNLLAALSGRTNATVTMSPLVRLREAGVVSGACGGLQRPHEP